LKLNEEKPIITFMEKKRSPNLGGARPNSGRKPFSPNHITREMREVIMGALDHFAPKIERILTEAAISNPLGALDRYIALADFCIPKLQRTEMSVRVEKEEMSFSDMIKLRDLLLEEKRRVEGGIPIPQITQAAANPAFTINKNIIDVGAVGAVEALKVNEDCSNSSLVFESKVESINKQPKLSNDINEANENVE
jgi:hypothetical protein